MSKQEYVWKKDFWGNWKLVPKPDSGIGAFFVFIFLLIVACICIVTTPFWLALLGFGMNVKKRYYAFIASIVSFTYFYIDVENQWITGFLFTSHKDGGEPLFKEEYLDYVWVINLIGIAIACFFLYQSYSSIKNDKQDYLSTDSQILSNDSDSKTNESSNNKWLILWIFVTGLVIYGTFKIYHLMDLKQESLNSVAVTETSASYYESHTKNNDNTTTVTEQEKLNEEDLLAQLRRDSAYISENAKAQANQYSLDSMSEENNAESINLEEATFIGGEEALYKFIGKNINYPEMEKDAGISGIVIVSFDVLADGSVSNCEISRGVKGGPGLDREALRVIQLLPKFQPEIKDGIAVSSKKRYPIKFVLR